jgi:hypothetical protein
VVERALHERLDEAHLRACDVSQLCHDIPPPTHRPFSRTDRGVTNVQRDALTRCAECVTQRTASPVEQNTNSMEPRHHRGLTKFAQMRAHKRSHGVTEGSSVHDVANKVFSCGSKRVI